MNKRNRLRKSAIGLSMVLLTLNLAACGNNSNIKDTTEELTGEVSSGKFTINAEFSDFDLDDTWDESTASKIQLNGDSISFSGDVAAASGSIITITEEGTYVISGTLDDGQIIVDVDDTQKVKLVLNGTELNCSNSAPIYVVNSDKTVITLADGTTNTVNDGDSYEYADAAEEEPNAAIYSNDDLTINGNGSLTVNANFNNGITGKDDLKIVSGSIAVTAANNGITGKDSLLVKDGDIFVDAGGDGIRTNNDTEAEQGYIYIGNGTFTIVSGEDSFQADTCMLIEDGEITIQSGGGSSTSSIDASSNWGNWGNGQKGGMNQSQSSSASSSDEASAKGIKAGVDLTVNSGTITIDSSDDALHTNDTMTIEDVDLTINSGDDGLHADTSLTIDGGTIKIEKSYEGIESSTISINGGTIDITSNDDGINSAGGNDSSASDGRPGQNNFTANADNVVNINGGTITINAAGDGLDSNGNINMTDGEVIIFGPTDNGNGALDYDGTFTLTGGSIIAAGSIGMVQTISDSSSQYCISVGFSSAQKAGTTIVIKDESGNEIVSVTPEKDFQSLVVSVPELENGASYSIYAGGSQVYSCTLSDIVTSVGTSSSGNMGEPGMR